MDEPTSGLDPRARRRLIEQLKKFEHTKIIASHDLDLAVDVCERTIVIHQGGVTADGPTLEILQNEALLEKSGLEKPLQMQNCPLCGPSNPKSDKSKLNIEN
jgi:cobalt/nickel transport system ATP-binding protein